MNTEIKVNGLNWPLRLGPYATLLGPANNLGSFRWYYGFFSREDENYDLKCFKLDGFSRMIAFGKLDNLSIDILNSEKQKSQTIAKCIRNAQPFQQKAIV
jgi:hypothetical protein